LSDGTASDAINAGSSFAAVPGPLTGEHQQPCVPAEEFEIDPSPIRSQDDARLEPLLWAGPLWIEFEEADRLSLEPTHPSIEAPLLVGFEEPGEPDLDRLEARADEPPPVPGRRVAAIGVVGSLGVHLLPFLLLLGWSRAPGELPAAIPVQLVIEQPPPEPPAPEPPPIAPNRLASEAIADPASTAASPTRPPPAPVQPAPSRLAALVPPPKPTAPARPAAAAPAKPRPPRPREAPRAGRIPGPEATRDEYLAYLVALTRQHVDLLPMSLVGERRGETTLAVLVLGDGTIARIAIAQSSGYSDIDARIQQIVAAVRRFPPLPQRFQGPDLALKLRFRFPDAVLGR